MVRFGHEAGVRGGPLALAAVGFDWPWDRAALLILGYGYHPFHALIWLAVLSLLSAFLSCMTWEERSMAPNNDLVAASEGWQAQFERDCLPAATQGCPANPAAFWNSVNGPEVDWESYHLLAGGADMVIPVRELGQTKSWSPSKDCGPWGLNLWWARWLMPAAGWVVTALRVAAATANIQRRTPT